MNHRHRQVLHAVFAHPEPANLSGADVKAVLGEMGAEVEDRSGNRFAVTMKGHTALFHQADHSLTKDEVRQIRRFLIDRGVDPQRDFPV
ncbi:MAG: hypothetical protein R3C46_04385 [Hyphomonadaceae bacterium]